MEIPYWEEVIPYLVLIVNIGVFAFIRKVILRFSPERASLFLAETIATCELCCDVAELGVVYERHGTILYAIALILCGYWWCKAFGQAEACPCGPVEDLLFGYGSGDYLHRLAGEFLGAVLTAMYINAVWSFHLIGEHKTLHTTECQASLQTSMLYGAIIEGIITCISRLVAFRAAYWPENTAAIINAITTTVLVLVALTTTGGYFNPIMATALTLNCKGNTLMEHIIVYWIGALIGGFVARYLDMRYEINLRQKYE